MSDSSSSSSSMSKDDKNGSKEAQTGEYIDDSESNDSTTKQKRSLIILSSSSDDDERVEDNKAIGPSETNEAKDELPSSSSTVLCDFDEMLKKKRAENKIRRRRKVNNIELINDNDDAIARLIADMRQASRMDKELNSQRKPATNKMRLLPEVMKKLGKVDLIMAFVEANVLTIMTDWLAPMPYDKSLPHIKIRTDFLKILEDLKIDDYSRLKESGIGKAVMYLYRHPKEERQNKNRAGRIVTKWARPIFNLTSDFSDLTREDRQARDEDMAKKLGVYPGGPKSKRKEEESTPAVSLRPGDPGWVMRARVPMPSAREYIKRPNWTSEVDITQDQKKKVSRLEKHKRIFADRRRRSRQQHAMKISLEGRNMDM